MYRPSVNAILEFKDSKIKHTLNFAYTIDFSVNIQFKRMIQLTSLVHPMAPSNKSCIHKMISSYQINIRCLAYDFF